MSIKYQTPRNQVRILKQGDPDFILNGDDWAQYPRASVQLTRDCPGHIAEAVREGFRKGHIKLTAAVYDRELVWETLSR